MSESDRFYGDYTAFEKWEYKKIFYKSDQLQTLLFGKKSIGMIFRTSWTSLLPSLQAAKV